MKVLIIGIGSEIAYYTALKFAENGNKLYCTSRNYDDAKIITDDLIIRTSNREIVPIGFVPTNIDQQTSFFQNFIDKYELPDIILIAYGTLVDNDKIKNDFKHIYNELNINFISAASIINFFANEFEKRNSGTIAAISSVAGDRARGSNFVYGTAKGALSLFLQGIRSLLSNTKVRIITIKPGFVATKMTSHITPNVLFAQPKFVGHQIYKAIMKGKDIAYIPKFWYLIMLILKLIPESIFKKLKI